MLIVNSSSSRSSEVRSIGEVPMTCASVRPIASRPICSGVRIVSASIAISDTHPGIVCSLLVKITGSPPTGKSRRCGQPT